VLLDQEGLLASGVEDSDDSFVVGHYDLLTPGVDAESGELKILGAFLHVLPLVGQLGVKALCNIDVGETPPISEVLPHEHGKVVSTGKEAVVSHLHVLCVECEGSLLSAVSLALGNPLEARNAFKVPKLVPEDCLSGVLDGPVDHHKRAVPVLNAEKAHVLSREDVGDLWAKFVSGQVL